MGVDKAKDGSSRAVGVAVSYVLQPIRTPGLAACLRRRIWVKKGDIGGNGADNRIEF